MDKLPKFTEEHILAQSLKTPQAIETYEKLSLGAQIKAFRKKARLKQSELAKKIKTSQSVISRMEAGKQNFTIRTLIQLSVALGKKLHVKLQ